MARMCPTAVLSRVCSQDHACNSEDTLTFTLGAPPPPAPAPVEGVGGEGGESKARGLLWRVCLFSPASG